MKIFLLGLPGSGKTTLGQSLAKSLNIKFFDLDHEIEKKYNQTISNLFHQKGEEWFRTTEALVLQSLCVYPHDFVLALGGGTPCYGRNMKVVNEAGISIFLDVPTHIIFQRLLQANPDERPLFKGLSAESLNQKVHSLRIERVPFYSKAKFTISNNSIQVTDILTLLERKS